jgi:hypothetical protein
METEQSWNSLLRLLSSAKHRQLPPVVAGFDGFVDTILHAVAERRSSTEYSRLTTLKAFSERHNPKISTGAGDHFNAGFCLGCLLGGDLETNIRLGVANTGYYVREAKSPTLSELSGFVETLSQKPL